MLRKTKGLIIINILLLIFLLGLNFRLNNVNAQSNGDSLTIPTNFSMLELGEKNGTSENVGSIDIEIPSSSWNLTDIQLNFTDIKLEREIKTIEDREYSNAGRIFDRNPAQKMYALGVQINLTEATIIKGVYIYGSKSPETTEMIDVQLRGYDNLNNNPNSTIYSSVNFNVSMDRGWYLQNFSNPISLSPGNYYLVLNGSNIISPSTDFYWAYNDFDPTNPNLHSSEYENQWLNGVQNEPYLYKLIQKVNRSYSPEEINMTARLNGGAYQISNSILPGLGYLNISGINYASSEDFIKIHIENNISVEILFNVSYHIKLIKNLNSNGSVKIQENRDNLWTVNPIVAKSFSNYSIKFNFHESWTDIRVSRDDIDVTSQILFNQLDHFILIPNNTIQTGADWLISANSSTTSFALDVDRTEFLAGQELKFFISEPIMNGDYTFVLTDTFDDIIYTDNKTIPYDTSSFTYALPQTAVDGEYKAYIYWFNGTDAGLTTQVFMITLPLIIDWFLITSVIVIIGLTLSVSTTSYVLIKKNKKKKIARKEAIYDKCIDILNLNYVLIIEKKSTLNIYDQVFTEKKMNTVLLSGFLEAIRTFGIELTGSKEHSQIIKLDYHNSKILMAEFKNFRLILIMKELPSESFYDLISALSFEIEEKYGSYLETFKGDLNPFNTIEEVLKKHLGTTFLYPLKVVEVGKAKINTNERAMIDKALNLMKKNKTEYCFTTQLMQDKGYKSKEIETIFSLIDKKILQPFV